MNLIALSMLVSLILIVANFLDPRASSKNDRVSGIVKLSLGVLLGFVIILLYGLGLPGLRFLFMFIGVGGILHILLTDRLGRTFKLT